MKSHIALFVSILLIVGFNSIALAAETLDPAKLFPDISGWQKKGAVETYYPENLYEYIDGAAENFLSYGFKQLAVQNYASEPGRGLSAEIYFHGTAENAFGIYSSEKPAVGNYFPLGGQGYAEAGILNFVCSAYYVKLNGFDLGSNGLDVLTNLGRSLAGKIDATAALPEILQSFPGKGKIANSERFMLTNFLGHDFLRAAYTADYRVEGQNFQMFIMDAGSEGQARAMLEKYVALEKEKPGQNIQPGLLTVNDPYNGPIRIFWQGKFICGSSGQAPAAAGFIAELARNLSKQ